MNEIPSRDFGKLEGTVEQLEQRLEKTVVHFETRIEKLTSAVEELTAALNQTRGGWKLLAALGGFVSFCTVLALKFLGFLKGM